MPNQSEIKKIVNIANGVQPADFVIQNVNILNVITGETRLGNINIDRDTGMILSVHENHLEGIETYDAEGKLTAVPGFIDCHAHIESSMVTPQVFDEAALLSGTTTIFCDPHEIANVMGKQAFSYFTQSSENMVMDMMVGLSPCVPATKVETSGAELYAADLAEFIDHKNVYGVAEFMSIGDVMDQDPSTLEKLERFSNNHIDGHMPAGVTSAMMNAMACCGIRNCHENTDLDHAKEKLENGINVFIREGSVCKDAEILRSLATPFQSPFLGLCTDDRNPVDIAREGHIDHVIRTLLKDPDIDTASVYRIATWSAANHFGMVKGNPKGWAPRGLLAAGHLADIVFLEGDVRECNIHSVYKSGQQVTAQSFDNRVHVEPIGLNSVKLQKEITANDFKIKGSSSTVNGIGLIQDQIVTEYKQLTVPIDQGGTLMADPENDILKVAVLERHGRNGNIGKCFVQGFGIKEGALASSVGHDSHNITVVGACDEDMAIAVRHIEQMGGGKVVVLNGEIVEDLALPIAGLMSDKQDLKEIAQDLIQLEEGVNKLGSNWQDPIMMLSFLPLAVVPDAKITDQGLTRFNPQQGIFSPTLV